jgi:hypothetical protein
MAVASVQMRDDEAYVFVTGGRASDLGDDEDDDTPRSILEYVVSQRRWAEGPQMPGARVGAAAAAVVVGDEFFIYVVGGSDPTRTENCTEGSLATLVYNVNKKTWASADALPTYRSGLCVIFPHVVG